MGRQKSFRNRICRPKISRLDSQLGQELVSLLENRNVFQLQILGPNSEIISPEFCAEINDV